MAEGWDVVEDAAPYLWPAAPAPEQADLLFAELVGKQLVGKPAEFAGDPELQAQERVFGWVQAETEAGVGAAGRLRWPTRGISRTEKAARLRRLRRTARSHAQRSEHGEHGPGLAAFEYVGKMDFPGRGKSPPLTFPIPSITDANAERATYPYLGPAEPDSEHATYPELGSTKTALVGRRAPSPPRKEHSGLG